MTAYSGKVSSIRYWYHSSSVEEAIQSVGSISRSLVYFSFTIVEISKPISSNYWNTAENRKKYFHLKKKQTIVTWNWLRSYKRLWRIYPGKILYRRSCNLFLLETEWSPFPTCGLLSKFWWHCLLLKLVENEVVFLKILKLVQHLLVFFCAGYRLTDLAIKSVEFLIAAKTYDVSDLIHESVQRKAKKIHILLCLIWKAKENTINITGLPCW